ncbi:MAG: hypothetical protein N3E49_09675, partial [Bacteroidia bacterium]|nr:hypothetical protein [Bacteroidia bacterium]
MHVAPRIWAVDYNVPFSYVAQGTIYQGEVRASVGSCLAEYFLPTPEPRWGALIPLVVTDFEHLVRDANRLTTNLHPVLAVLADTVREHIPRLDYTERAELSADAYILYPRPLNEDAQLQSQAGFGFLGHVREAVEQ